MEGSKNQKPLHIGFLNIMGQSKLSLSKQKQIEHFLKTQNLDILHLQESFIEEASFHLCPFISNNFQILFINNEIKYGVCSLVHKSLPTSNEIFHPSGRYLSFNIGDFTFANVYLPSGNDNTARSSRENLLGQDIPNFLINGKQDGLIGGDFNAITSKLDCTANPEQKMSQNLKKLISAKKWKDTYRALHPSQRTFSHYYNRVGADGILSQGASRLDRSYLWGQSTVSSSSYLSVAFSDHLAHVVQLSGGTVSRSNDDSPNFKPNFKISAEVAGDEIFQNNVKEIVTEYRRFKSSTSLQLWWDSLKRELKRAAKRRNQEMKKERQSELNLLMTLQAFYSKKVQQGNLQVIGQLKATQLRITEWFNVEAEKIKIFAKIQDIEKSEKVRIYHHDLHRKTMNKSTILKLKTPNGDISGHKACSKFLSEEVRSLWENEVKLDEKAQEELLKEVEKSFTEEDNKLLESTITNQEIKESLDKCNMRSAPGTDCITYQVFHKCWHILGEDLSDVLREIVKSGKPTETMKHCYLIFTPKPKKGASLLPKDLRKISLLNTDFKILSGVFANRLRKMEDHTISNIQYSVKPRKINHAICTARDAIHAVNPKNKGCGLAEFDFQAAFDFLSVEGWTWKVFEAKGASPAFIRTMKALYTDPEGAGFCIPVINNDKTKRIKNIRKVLKQGDRVSCTLYCYSVDPLLMYLDKRLQGITIHKQKTYGPRHPKLGLPKPIESKFKLAGYIDDIKTSICNIQEFHILDKALHLFEASSACKLHRDVKSGKCNLLPLGQWSKKWKQDDVPLKYLKITDNLSFLGVQLAQNSSKTRQINGEFLIEKVKKTIDSFKSGKFSPLTCRPHATNTYVMSKLIYRAATVDLRCSDTKKIQNSIKSYVSQDMLLRPNALILFRGAADGGLELLHTASRCLAILIKTFVDQAHPCSPCSNLFLKSLFRAYITEDIDKKTVKRPPYYPISAFNIIKQVYEDQAGNIMYLPTKRWQQIILENGITHKTNRENGEISLLPTSQETSIPDADWPRSRSNRVLQGLPPSNKSLIFKWSENLVVNQERLFRLGKADSPVCEFCQAATDNREHLWMCPLNSHICSATRNMLDTYADKRVNPINLCVVDFSLPVTMELPIMFIFSSILEMLIDARKTGKTLEMNQTKTLISVMCNIYLHTKKKKATTGVVNSLLQEFFI